MREDVKTNSKKMINPVAPGVAATTLTIITFSILQLSGQLKVAMDNPLYATLLFTAIIIVFGSAVPKLLLKLFGKKIETKTNHEEDYDNHEDQD